MQLNKLFQERAVSLLSFLLLGVAISFLSWQTGWLIFLLGLPIAYRVSRNRWDVFCAYFGYYLFGSHSLIEIVPAFFEGMIDSKSALAVLVWLLWALMLSTPYLILNKKSHVHYVSATLLTIVPPIGIFGWMSCVNVAGLLFPNMGMLGIVLAVAFMSFAAVGTVKQMKFVAYLLIPVMVSANVIYVQGKYEGDTPATEYEYQGNPDSPYLLKTLNTELPHNGAYLSSTDEVENIEYLKLQIDKAIVGKKKDLTLFMVLPEEVLGAWGAAKSFWWGSYIARLQEKQVYLIAGGDHHIKGSNKFDDAVFLMTHAYREGVHYAVPYKITAAKIPMPGGNWNILKLGNKSTAELDLHAQNNAYQVVLNGQRIHFSVCYEDFLIWPHVNAAIIRNSGNEERPKLMISMANNWFETEQTLAFKIQQASIGAMSRLFGTKLLRAVNTKNTYL